MSPSNFVCVAQARGESAIEDVVRELEASLQGRTPKLVAAFLSPDLDWAPLNERLARAWPEATRISSTSAGEFTHVTESQGGVVAWALGGEVKVHAGFADGLHEDLNGAVERVGATIPDEVPDHPHRVGIVLLDPMAGCAEQTTLMMAMNLERGEPVRLVGGAAADDFSMSQARIAVNDQQGHNAVGLAMIYSKQPFGIGVGHGHSAQSEELTVTRSQANVVYELDGKPAWEVWLQEAIAIAQARGWPVPDPDNLDETKFFLTYQSGIRIDGDEIKIRTPLKLLEDGGIQFAGALAEGAKIRITCGSAASQVESAQRAANDARAQLGEAPVAGALVFDCICRKLILKDDFIKAVSAASEAVDGQPLAGFETYGEIALNDGDFSGFHNTSTVVLAVPA